MLKSSKSEKLLYALGDIGCNMIWTFTGSFLTLYYTDSVGLAAAYVGTMMLICRLFDGLSDVVMGIIIDRTKTRWGKARPWILFSAIPLVLAYWALYNVPASMSQGGKSIYAFITYFFLSVVFYTMCNIAYHALLQRFSLSSQDRSVVSTVRTLCATVAILVISLVTPSLLAALGGEKNQQAWTMITLIYGSLAIICLLVTFFGVKEKLPVEKKEEKEKKVKGETARGLKILLSGRYFYITVFVLFAFYASQGSTSIYFSRDVLGNVNLFGITNMFMMIPMVLGIPFLPAVFKKFGKRNTMLLGMIISVAASLGILIAPQNPVVYIACAAVRQLSLSPLATAAFTLAGDIVDYNQMRTGIRTEGITTSANSLGNKLGSGLGAALLGWLLSWGNYNGALTVQPDSAINAMIIHASVVPAVLMGLAAIAFLFWDLEKYQPEVIAFMEEQAQEADHDNGKEISE